MKISFAHLLAWILVILLSAGLAYGGYRYVALQKLFAQTRATLEETVVELQNALATMTSERDQLSEALYSEQQKNADFEAQIEEIAGTVGVLDKLAKTDPELLQKYSKVCFLNEHYAPSKVRRIDPEYIYSSTDKEEYVHAEVWPELKDLFEAAKKDGVELLAVSAFRSFSEQAGLKSNYTVTYGTGANTFSADQGYSEHQLGTTLDFTTKTLGANFTNFESTDGYAWLTKNAYKYSS